MKCLDIWVSYKDTPGSYVKLCSVHIDRSVESIDIKLNDLEK